MSMPAGWYDDGSGRQRWWDGAQWTDDYAPVQGAGSAQPAAEAPAPAASAPVTSAPAATSRPSPVLGFVGLGLAVLGTVLACIPAVFGLGMVVLLAGFVVSLIGLFKKNAPKWPSIVGMIVSVVGGVIGAIVLVVSLVANLPSPIDTAPATNAPPSTSAEPSDPPTGESDSRPSPEEIAEGFAATIRAGGITTYDDMPEFYPCVGQYLYDSELSDDALRLIMAGGDPPEAERETAEKAIGNAVLTCDPQASDPSPQP
ncbi:DUF2510 domain-containing protein [Microbacterium sp. W4I20]|uniref:DUF2510 domain-containing protein n=1 Tax=Microbacterium sp. W4I20 TaxID=3042262 RepID=UPI00278A5833|nr:DUF2510 domain-containing protein [Microbacterium sp. W4I20]MDQ0726911.1 type IV secretory pathway VirB2 component (pilin) [Microbacterium sp. W4I20]